MTHPNRRSLVVLGLVVAGLLWNGEIWPTSKPGLVGTAEARVARPATPVSYAGVARRTTVGAGGVGGPASGVGVLPGAGAGQAGVGGNVGGPVNRAGVR